MLTGGMSDAFIEQCSGWNLPSHFFTATTNPQHLDWWNKVNTQRLKDNHLAWELHVPGHAAMAEDIREYVIAKPP